MAGRRKLISSSCLCETRPDLMIARWSRRLDLICFVRGSLKGTLGCLALIDINLDYVVCRRSMNQSKDTQ